MKKTIMVATQNKGKAAEIKSILSGLECEVLTMGEAGIDIDIEETGMTFTQNSYIKAKAIHDIVGLNVLADDSGLEIDFLNGLPGIYTARFAGYDSKQEEKNNKIIGLLKDIPDKYRTARFVCAISFIGEDQSYFTVQSTFEGRIAHCQAGSNGFGYDPIFYVPEYQKTAAELDKKEKNILSHRGKALMKLREKLKLIHNG